MFKFDVLDLQEKWCHELHPVIVLQHYYIQI